MSARKRKAEGSDGLVLPSAKRTKAAAPDQSAAEDRGNAADDGDDDLLEDLEDEPSDTTHIHPTSMKLLMDSMSKEQRERHEMFRRAKFQHAEIRKFLQSIDVTVTNKIVLLLLGGVAKVFLGELVEEARDLMNRNGQTGAITPRYLREAMRRLRRKPGSLLENRPHHRLF